MDHCDSGLTLHCSIYNLQSQDIIHNNLSNSFVEVLFILWIYINMYHSSCDDIKLRVFWAKCPSFCRWSQALPGKVILFKDMSFTYCKYDFAFFHTTSWWNKTTIEFRKGWCTYRWADVHLFSWRASAS